MRVLVRRLGRFSEEGLGVIRDIRISGWCYGCVLVKR